MVDDDRRPAPWPAATCAHHAGARRRPCRRTAPGPRRPCAASAGDWAATRRRAARRSVAALSGLRLIDGQVVAGAWPGARAMGKPITPRPTKPIFMPQSFSERPTRLLTLPRILTHDGRASGVKRLEPWPASGEQPIIIKKVKKGGHGGHHGGAWKVAYADFVTAMMAFFLLMWLINTTSPEQKRGIADYFAPASVSAIDLRLGRHPGRHRAGRRRRQGRRRPCRSSSRWRPRRRNPKPTRTGQAQHVGQPGLAQAERGPARRRWPRRSRTASPRAAQSLRQALQDMPELAELSKQILIDQTPEGLRIQLVDQEGRSMFDTERRPSRTTGPRCCCARSPR